MGTETYKPLPKDSPLRKAWAEHKRSDEYANAKRWATRPGHVDGSMWTVFVAGWEAAQQTERAQGERWFGLLRHTQEFWRRWT
jgi:hypothetical protein